MSLETMVLLAILTALVVVLQLVGAFIRFGMFSISLVLLPIVVGAATCGIGAGAWLGLVFGIVVLLSGDATAFLTVDPFGTIVTVLVKGTACGLAAGLIYKPLDKLCAVWSGNIKSIKTKWLHKAVVGIIKYLPVVAAAIVCPVVNTGIFLIGCVVFFLDTVAEWGAALGFSNAAEYIFIGLAGGNFLFELATNLVLSPIVVRLLDIRKSTKRK